MLKISRTFSPGSVTEQGMVLHAGLCWLFTTLLSQALSTEGEEEKKSGRTRNGNEQILSLSLK